MKTFKKLLAGAAVSVMMMTSAYAGTQSIAGVMLDPNSPFDFSGTTANIFQRIDPVTGALSGYGTITKINNLDNIGANAFCPGCELTIVFDGYTPTSFGSVPTIGGVAQTFKYTGGSVRLYIDFSPDTDLGDDVNLANASDGALWLGMAGHADADGNTLTGENSITTIRALNGSGALDVLAGALAGGLARDFLDTNTRPLLPGTTTRADLSFSASFTTFLSLNAANVPVLSYGTANFNGDTQVPEPGSLALLGLGFAGIAAIRRRKVAAK